MKSKKYYWKVVCKVVGGSYYSYSFCKNTHKYCLTYQLNRVTTPKIGKIFVFNTRQQARRFKEYAVNGYPLKIMKVIGTNPKPLSYRARINSFSIQCHWNLDCDFAGEFKCPPGTIGVDSVLPVGFE